MDIDLAALPDDVTTLQRMMRTLAAERTALSEAQAEIERLQLIVQKLQRNQLAHTGAHLEAFSRGLIKCGNPHGIRRSCWIESERPNMIRHAARSQRSSV
jgi:hypothetical protein